MIQSERKNSSTLSTFLKLTFAEEEQMDYIPLSLKYSNSELFGKFLALQNNFLENHRNVALVGISVESMEAPLPYGDMEEADDDDVEGDKRTIRSHLKGIPGITRVDPCRRTTDLGKWNIATTDEAYPAVTKWLDENLIKTFQRLPDDIQERSSFSEFTFPRRLKKTTRPATENAPKQAYVAILESKASPVNNSTPVHRSPWRSPVTELSYAFVATEFPPMQATRNDTLSTESSSSVSSPNEQAVKDAVDLAMKDFTETMKRQAAASDARLTAVEESITSIQTELASLSTTIVTRITSQIYNLMRGPDTPYVTKAQLDLKLAPLAEIQLAITQLSAQVMALSRRPSTPDSPTRKVARLLGPDDAMPLVGMDEGDPTAYS